MRYLVSAIVLAASATLLSACETAGVNEGPVEYATRPDYRDVYRRPPPPPIRYLDPPPRYDRYEPYRDPYDRPPPRRPYRSYDGYDGYDRY